MQILARYGVVYACHFHAGPLYMIVVICHPMHCWELHGWKMHLIEWIKTTRRRRLYDVRLRRVVIIKRSYHYSSLAGPHHVHWLFQSIGGECTVCWWHVRESKNMSARCTQYLIWLHDKTKTISLYVPPISMHQVRLEQSMSTGSEVFFTLLSPSLWRISASLYNSREDERAKRAFQEPPRNASDKG
jgi:hypothetical protein